MQSDPWDDVMATAFNAPFAEWRCEQQLEWVEGRGEVCGDCWEWRRRRIQTYFANRTDLRRKLFSETAEHTPYLCVATEREELQKGERLLRKLFESFFDGGFELTWG